MSYSVTDATTHTGQPIHLIRFDYLSTTYRYTTGDTDFNDGIDTWTAYEIEPAKDINVSDNLAQAAIELLTKIDNPVAQLFRTNAIESSVSCLIYEVHTTDTSAEAIQVHSGRIVGRRVKLKGSEKQAVLTSEPLLTAMKRPAIREKIGKYCPYVLYDSDTCKATKTPYPGTVTSVSGTSLVVSGADAVTSGQLKSGYIETSEEKRMITSHSGTSISVTTAMEGLEVGDAVTLYIGCNHTTNHCEQLHDNIVNYGGEPFIPDKNPNEGRIV